MDGKEGGNKCFKSNAFCANRAILGALDATHAMGVTSRLGGAPQPEVVAALGIDTEREAVWCGVALGYPDPSAPVNKLETERARRLGPASCRTRGPGPRDNRAV